VLRRIFSHVLGWEAARLMGVARSWRSWIARDAANWELRVYREFHVAASVEALRARVPFGGGTVSGLHAALATARLQLDNYSSSRTAFAAGHAALCTAELLFWQEETTLPSLSSGRARDAVRLLWPRSTWLINQSAPTAPAVDLDVPDNDDFLGFQVAALWRRIDEIERRCPALHPSLPPYVRAVSFRSVQTGNISPNPTLAVFIPSQGEAETDWLHLYRTAARDLLADKCRVCNMPADYDVHPVLGVRMCLQCRQRQGQYSVMLRSAACDTLVAAMGIPVTKARKMLAAVRCTETGKPYRTRKRRRAPLVLRSSLDALLCARRKPA